MKRATAILTGRFIRTIFMEHQREFVEHFQYGKQIGKILGIKKQAKTSRGPKTHLLGLEYEKSGNQVPNFEKDENMNTHAHESSVQNGSYAFPNELMRFRIEATPI